MKLGLLLPIGFAVIASASQAQTFSRQANMRGGGNGGDGKCTVEVVVDGAAQVQIRGGTAQLVNLKGQPPQWRRFECTSPMPQNPDGFRFSGVDGRGSQQLVREPRNGSPAVIEINDPDNGAEGYTFDITWSARGGYQPQGQYQPQTDYRGGYNRGDQGRGFGVDQATAICQDTIRRQAADRFRTNNIQFRQTTIDDNPGRGDWVIGTVDIRLPRQQDQLMRFSCSVNFMSGQVRSASMEPIYAQQQAQDPQRANGRAIQNCERAAQQRVVSQGFDNVTLGNSRFDSDGDPRVMGDLRAYGRYGSQSFRFSCRVDPRDGDVQNLDITSRDEGR